MAAMPPSCACQGSLLKSSFIAISLLPLGLVFGFGQAVDRRAHLEANQLGANRALPRFRGGLGAAVHDFDRLLQDGVRPQVADEIGEADERRGPPLDGEERAVL